MPSNEKTTSKMKIIFNMMLALNKPNQAKNTNPNLKNQTTECPKKNDIENHIFGVKSHLKNSHLYLLGGCRFKF